jgi:hypothetical protein
MHIHTETHRGTHRTQTALCTFTQRHTGKHTEHKQPYSMHFHTNTPFQWWSDPHTVFLSVAGCTCPESCVFLPDKDKWKETSGERTRQNSLCQTTTQFNWSLRLHPCVCPTRTVVVCFYCTILFTMTVIRAFDIMCGKRLHCPQKSTCVCDDVTSPLFWILLVLPILVRRHTHAQVAHDEQSGGPW